MQTLTDNEIIEALDVRVRIVASPVEPSGREVQVHVLVRHHDIYGQPFLAQLDGDWGEASDQLEDDFTNNGDIDDETLIRAFGFEFPAGELGYEVEGEESAREAAFEDAREHIENVVAEHAINVARVTIAAMAA